MADRQRAERFVDYLLTRGIAAHCEEASEGFTIWVEDDDQLDAAQAELGAFEASPEDPKYDVGGAAERLRREEQNRSDRLRRQHIDVRTRWHVASHGATPLTYALMVICLVVAAGSNLGEKQEPLLNWLYFASPERWVEGAFMGHEWLTDHAEDGQSDRPAPGELDLVIDATFPSPFERRWNGMAEIREGQLWRLVTPMFIHFGMLHLVFNLFWVYNFGGMIESRKGWPWLLALVLGTSLIASVGEYAWSGSPLFGGMSGVVYGLFGYIWLKGRLQPHEQLFVHQHTVLILMVWLVLCMTGALGSIANAAHVGGLLAGLGVAGGAFGLARLQRWRRLNR